MGGRTNLTKTPFLVLFVILISASVGIASTADAQLGEVPDWFKDVAGFWSGGDITTVEFLDGIEFLIENDIIKVPGYVQAAEAQSVDQESLEEIWATIDSLQDQIDSIGETQGSTNQILGFYTVIKEIERVESQYSTLEIFCDEGDTSTGGGWTTSTYGGDPMPYTSVPWKNGWIVSVENNGVHVDLTAYVICADYFPSHGSHKSSTTITRGLD